MAGRGTGLEDFAVRSEPDAFCGVSAGQAWRTRCMGGVMMVLSFQPWRLANITHSTTVTRVSVQSVTCKKHTFLERACSLASWDRAALRTKMRDASMVCARRRSLSSSSTSCTGDLAPGDRRPGVRVPGSSSARSRTRSVLGDSVRGTRPAMAAGVREGVTGPRPRIVPDLSYRESSCLQGEWGTAT